MEGNRQRQLANWENKTSAYIYKNQEQALPAPVQLPVLLGRRDQGLQRTGTPRDRPRRAC